MKKALARKDRRIVMKCPFKQSGIRFHASIAARRAYIHLLVRSSALKENHSRP